MKRLAGYWRFWVELFSRREAGASLGCFRVAIGAVLVYSLVSVLAADLIDVLWIDIEHGGYGPRGRGNWLLARLGGTTPATVYGVYAVALLGALATMAGIGGRVTILLTLQCYNALITINPFTSGGYDLMLTNALWLLFLGDAMASHSLRCRLRTGAWTSQAVINAWPRYLLIFQLIAVYTATGLYKLSADWTPAGGYEALYHIFQDPTWRRFDMDFTAHVFPLTQLATAMVWHWETAFWLMLPVFYYRDTREREGRLRRAFNRWDLRKALLFVGLGMHIGILVAFNVGPFSWVSVSYYLCFFAPAEVDGALARLAALGRRLLPDKARSRAAAIGREVNT
jgi:hypothetical protein